MPWLDDLTRTVHFAARSLRRTPALCIGIILLLSLGVGANVAIFSLADTLFLRQPSGVAAPRELRRIYARSNWSVGEVTEIHSLFSFPAYRAVATAYGPHAALAAYTPPDSVILNSTGQALQVAYATSNLLPLLGVQASLGRVFSSQEDEMGAGSPVAVISDAVWRRQFNAASDVLGQHLDMAGLRYTVVGVTPKGFTGPDLNRTDVWLPMSTYPGGTIGVRPWYAHWRGGFIVRLIERPVDASVTDAWLSSVGTIALRQGEEANVPTHPDTATLLAGPLLETLGPALQPRIEEVITTRVMAVTFLVLLIACANVANLLLLRTLRRRGEIAIRLALGVSRVRLLLQLLTESLLLSLIAGIAALGVAAWLGGMLRRMLLPDVHLAGGALGARLLTVAILLAIGVGCLSALLPAMRTSRPDLTDALNSGIRESGGRHSRMRTTLLVVQVGFSVVLLAGAGMFVHSLHAVLSINVGYDRDRLVYGMVRFRNPVDRRVTYYPENRDALTVGLTNTAARLEKEPGVEHVALSTAPPMGGWGMTGVFFANGRKVPRLENRDPAIIWVTASYFAAAGLELTRGRFFTEIEASSPVVVINETAARTYWPGQDALGKCLVIGPGSAPCSTVVGVAKDTHLKAFLETPNAELLAPTKKPLVLVARAQGGEAERVTKEMRADLRLAFPNAELPYITTVAAAHEPELRPWRLGATLFSAFGVVALVVASIGTYSVVSFTISQRLHEIGIRIAIGARTRDILRAVMGDAIRPIMYGLAIGIALTLLLSRAVELILFDTSPRDPIILGLVSLLLVGAGLLASAIPVARATRVDPVTVLRAE